MLLAAFALLAVWHKSGEAASGGEGWKRSDEADLSGFFSEHYQGGGLPRVIHQSWKNEELPEWFQNTSATFKAHNPGFKYLLWTDAANEALVKEYYASSHRTWSMLPRTIMRVDAVRAMYMHRYGGLYFDLDFWCLQPLESAAANLSGVVLGYMTDDISFNQAVPNAFMASEPGQPFWLYFLARMMHAASDAKGRSPEEITGPVALYRAVKGWKNQCKKQGVHHNITIMPREVWYVNDWHKENSGGGDWWSEEQRPTRYCTPKHWDLQKCTDDSPSTLTVTHWTHSWQEVKGSEWRKKLGLFGKDKSEEEKD